MAKKTTLAEFESVFPKLEEVLLEHAQKYKLPKEELAWYKKASIQPHQPNMFPHHHHRHEDLSLEINTLGGKCNRGMSVPDSVSLLLDKPLNEEEYFQAATLGWMTELLQAFFLVSDDIMDSSITRRGKPCWYRHEGVGMVAINDAFLLESAIYSLLRKFFREHASYVDLLELFHEVTFQTELGQLCDLLTAPRRRSTSTTSAWRSTASSSSTRRPTTPSTCPSPSPSTASTSPPQEPEAGRGHPHPLGEYFQIQDDYLDNFGLPEHIGKIGTDIMDNKCSWLRKILEENYGQKDKAKEAVIKKLFDDMKLKERFEEFEERRANEIKTMINNIDESEGLKKGIFDAFLAKIYKRSK
ncbi:farnesyl pyrophosphate synthetase [Colletotrichum tofieldiae]|nr:farnesyl pyrophosphate synthetase [Colletotrichum tofieldiae]